MYVYVCLPSGPYPPACPPASAYGQAGAPREAAGGGAEKVRGKRWPDGGEKARRRTVYASAAVRYELRERARKIGRKIPGFEAKRR